MMRACCCGLVLVLAFSGCRQFEHEGAMPLPDNAPPLSYEDMLNRARGQSSAALDAFYIDAWMELEQAADRLEQTARLLPKTIQIPEAIKSKLDGEANELRQDALKLREAARGKNAAQANEAMQRINQRVRLLRAIEKK